jgi:cyclomaltodextrinase / maltogenic alpha-amylase / neopullulanase
MNEPKLGIYKHYKGGLYILIGVAKHSETLEKLVVYEHLGEKTKGQLWVRPLEMFMGKVEIDGKVIPRFEYIKNK